MRWSDILLSSFRSLFRRRLRSALTILGVVIGTCAIIITLSLGYGAEQAQMELMESSTNLKLIQVYPYYSYSGDSLSATRKITRITDSVLRSVRSIPGVSAVTPVVSFYPSATLRLQTGEYSAYAYMTAVLPADFYKLVDMESGSGFSNRTDRMEFLLNEVYMCEFRTEKTANDYIDVWSYLTNGEDLPVPAIRWLRAEFHLNLEWQDTAHLNTNTGLAETKSRDEKAACVGTFAADANDWTFSNGPIVSLTWLKRFVRDNKELMQTLGVTDASVSNYDTVYVLADSVDHVEQLVRDLTDMGLQCYSPMDYVNTFKQQLGTMQAFLGIIGAIAMLVAALSIANTMMMSIYERTREIGVMKVLGCPLGNIRAMFLCEAALIGLIGGCTGVIASYALSWALNNIPWLQQAVSSVMSSASMYTEQGSTVSLIPPALAAATWAGVLAVSVLSGLSPAQRAMRLSSLAAIRNAD